MRCPLARVRVVFRRALRLAYLQIDTIHHCSLPCAWCPAGTVSQPIQNARYQQVRRCRTKIVRPWTVTKCHEFVLSFANSCDKFGTCSLQDQSVLKCHKILATICDNLSSRLEPSRAPPLLRARAQQAAAALKATLSER